MPTASTDILICSSIRNDLLGMLKKRIADGTDVPCITGNVLKDPDAKLNDGKK